jgi:phosphatidylinositol glycan class B
MNITNHLHWSEGLKQTEKLHLRLFSISLLAILGFQAYHSIGFYHPDEHYQILEFAMMKFDKSRTSGLAWEYASQIRNGIQPLIAFLCFRALKVFNITDPFYLALFLRAVTCLYAFFTIRAFTFSSLEKIGDKYRISLLLLTVIVWFLPMLNVRFSSENYSGLAILNALTLLNRDKGKNLFFVGFFFGLAFLFRFQSALFSAGIYLFLITVKREKIPRLAISMTAFILVTCLGVVIDYWLYEKIVLSAYNYFTANIVQDIASSFGTAPWYYLVTASVKRAFYPLGILIWSATAIVAVARPKELIIWGIIPFVLVHSMIPHKEIRFLFPLINLIPYILVLGYQTLSERLKISPVLWIPVVSLAAITNLMLLSYTYMVPLGKGQIAMAETIDRRFHNQHVNLYYLGQRSNPYQPYEFLQQNFYLNPTVHPVSMDSQSILALSRSKKGINLIVVAEDGLLPGPLINIMSVHRTELLYSTRPTWAKPFIPNSVGDENPTYHLFRIF